MPTSEESLRRSLIRTQRRLLELEERVAKLEKAAAKKLERVK